MKVINNINLDQLKQEIKDLIPKSYFVNDIVAGYDSAKFYCIILVFFAILWISGAILFNTDLISFIVSVLFTLIFSFTFLFLLQKKRKRTILKSCENAETERDFIVLIEYLQMTHLDHLLSNEVNFMNYAYDCIQALTLADLLTKEQLLDINLQYYCYNDDKGDVWKRYYKIPDTHQSINVKEPTLTLNNHGASYRIPYKKESD